VAGQTDPHGAPAKTVFRLALGEPTAIDPYNSRESGGVLITKNLYEGLLTIDSRTTELRPGVAVGNGPFKMKEPWRHDVGITLVRNDTYSGPKPALDEVRFHHPALPVPSRTPPP
jgi:ABC-type oligopeptide transport system substrate-binding subunit